MTSRGYCPQFEVLENRTMLTGHVLIEHHKPPQELKHFEQTIKIEKAEDRSHLQYCIAIPIEHKARGGTVLTEPQKKWLQALRSDKFKQCRGKLHEDGGFCCLGVACEIFKEELGLRISDFKYKYVDGGYTIYNDRESFLPEEVRRHLQLKTDNGEWSKSKDDRVVTNSLADLNDNGYSFNEIANFIEENADQLFYSNLRVIEQNADNLFYE